MIRHFEHDKINREKWDACVDNAAQQLPYAFSWYLDLASENWSGLVLNDYEAVMPLPFKNKFGIKYVYQPFFTQQLGVFGNTDARKFIVSIPSGYRHVHTNLNFLNTIEKFKQVKEQVNLILPLRLPFEELKSKFSENCRRNIKKSAGNNFHIKKCSAKDLVEVFRLNRGKEISHLKENNYKTLLKLIENLERRELAESLGIYDEQMNFYGGAVILKYKQRNIFFFSALSEEGKNKGGMYFFLNHFLCQNAGSENIFDFEGSNNPSLARFYAGFGATEQNYFSYVNNRLPLPLKLFKK